MWCWGASAVAAMRVATSLQSNRPAVVQRELCYSGIRWDPKLVGTWFGGCGPYTVFFETIPYLRKATTP